MRSEIQTIVNQLLLNDGTSDTQLASTAQKLLKSRRHTEYLTELDEFIKKTEDEIESICNENHHEFVLSVDQLVKVRLESETLKSQVSELGSEFGKIARSLHQEKYALLECQKLDANMTNSVEALTACIKLLRMVKKAKSEIAAKRYYHSLRTIDDIQGNHLRNVQDFEFAQVIKNSLPSMKMEVKNLVLNEMRDWLSKIRDDSKVVGSLAIQLAHTRDERIRNRADQSRVTYSHATNAILEQFANDEWECNLLDNDEVKITFQPLLQCIHIFDVLGCQQEFRMIFEENRRLQADLFQTTGARITNDLMSYKNLLQEIVGFFIIEFHMMNASQKYRSRSKVFSLWDICINKIKNVCSEGLRDCQDGELFLRVKDATVEFIRVMEGYSYQTQTLLDFMKTLFNRYLDHLKTNAVRDLLQILKEDDNQNFVLINAQQMEDMSKLIKCLSAGDLMKDVNFPKKMPFNKIVVDVFHVLSDVITSFYLFVDNNHLQTHATDELARKTIDYLLSNVIINGMRVRISNGKLDSVISNMTLVDHFLKTCSQVEDLLNANRYVRDLLYKTLKTHRYGDYTELMGCRIHGNESLSFLSSRTDFKLLRKEAEERVFELIITDTDRILSKTTFQWMASSIQKTATSSLQEFLAYIDTLNEKTLVFLPAQERAYICFQAFSHLSEVIISRIINPEVKKFNYYFVENLNIDVTFLEAMITKLDNPNLFGIFTLLRETVELLRNDKFEEYLDDSIRRRKYSQLKGSMVVQLFEKLKESTPINTAIDAKARKKAVESFIKAVRDRPSLM